MITLSALVVAHRYGHAWWRHVAGLYWQGRCAAYTLPAGSVVYDEDPKRVPGLLRDRERYVALTPTPSVGPDRVGFMDKRLGSAPAGIAAAAVPECLERLTGRPFTTARGGRCNAGLLYLGQHRDPSGGRWIIAVYPVEPWRSPTRPVQFEFDATVVRRGSAWRPPVVASTSRAQRVEGIPSGYINPYPERRTARAARRSAPRTLRISAGQSHATDPSRFVIPFEADGMRGVIEGQVDGQGNVSFEATEGPIDLVLDANERAELRRLRQEFSVSSDLARTSPVTP